MNFISLLLGRLKNKKLHSSFKDNIWGVDLADMQLIRKYNKGIRYLLCVIDLFSKHDFVVPLKDKKGIAIANAFQGILVIQKENQMIKAVNITKSFLKNG